MLKDTTVISFRQPDAVDDPLTELAREGARRMLAQALIAEADAFVALWKDLKLPDGRDRVVRHGHGPHRAIQTGVGPVEVRRGKVRDRGDVGAEEKIRFTSSILPQLRRRAFGPRRGRVALSRLGLPRAAPLPDNFVHAPKRKPQSPQLGVMADGFAGWGAWERTDALANTACRGLRRLGAWRVRLRGSWTGAGAERALSARRSSRHQRNALTGERTARRRRTPRMSNQPLPRPRC
jgi:hypothetical protein